MAIADVALIGLDRSVDPATYLAEMLKRYESEPDVRMELGGMGTTLEGETPKVWRRIEQIHELLFELGIKDVYTIVKFHDPRTSEHMLTSADKVAAVRGVM